MTKTNNGEGAISPVEPHQKLLAVPGTTDDVDVKPPIGRWKERTNLLLGRMATCKDRVGPIGPYMRAAQDLLPAMVQEVVEAAGSCGPIAQLHLCSSAKLAGIAHFLLDTADAITAEGKRDLTLASRLADASRLNSLDALKTAVAISRMAPRSTEDPLAAYLVAPSEPEK